ncbi:unnamed protein product [Rotaria magnacalcarata]|uniref:Uncharacterized protein n=1 Tax=Rotaria magnacalcarata TaxID=392030 RepID=A0A816LTJ6_9BILA|nr:unnamed protein product [Rotaria magnacalcarata]CAF1677917.1 unnamed protein product [Rotaria magnacalcarata]CAF1956479.1 unnamed protein product [Rotaria magnacalcarata]CAF4033714.1 unnamed protein product [Rotaria magnacalcarata]CAF4069444.1 unnamed protein product [Rotaria magnacalcarata]
MTNVSSYTIATVLILQTLCSCIIFTFGQYIYIYYLSKYPFLPYLIQNSTTVSARSYVQKINNNFPGKCSESGIVLNRDAQSWAQQRSADLFFWTNLSSCFPIIIMTYILGIYTPKLGRRFVLMIPIIGIACQLTIWLAIIYFHLPEYWWYIAAFIVGLSGSDNIRNFVLNLFITDNTGEHERSSHFVVFGAISMIVSAVGTFIIGYYIAWNGFTDLYWIALILQLISIFVVIFFLKPDKHHYKSLLSDSNTLPNSTDIQISELHYTSCLDLCKLFGFKTHSHKKSISLLLILVAYASYSFICTAFIVLLLYLLNAPFCWTSKHIGNYSAVALISFGTFSVLGMKILTKLGACDIVICIISHIFFCLASFWLAFAQYDWQMYIGLILTSFSGYQNLLTLSMISKWLEPHERTNVFTLVTEINTIMKVVGYCFFNWVYARTVVNYKNFTFLLASFLSMIPLLLNIILWFVSRKMPNEDNDRREEIDLTSTDISVSGGWTTQIPVANSILIPQQLSNLSRVNSLSSNDYEMKNIDHTDTL